MCSKVTVKHIWWIQRWKWRRRRREVEKLRVGFPRWNPLSQFAIYKQHHACIRRSRKGSKYKVQWFYLVGGEGILTIDFLILTRVVGFSPTFPKRGSNLVSATIYIFQQRTHIFHFSSSSNHFSNWTLQVVQRQATFFQQQLQRCLAQDMFFCS